MHKAHALVEIVFINMSDALCTKYGCDYQLDLDGQVTCTNCGAMDDDMLPRRTYNEPDLNQSGYGYDELKDFDDGYKGSRRSRITPFRGPLK